jgi:hypothetical protein
MVHVQGVSAAYRVHESSGVHHDAGPGGAATQRVYEKWLASWSAGQGAALMQRAWSCADLELDLAASRAGLEDANGNIARLSQAIARVTESIAHQTNIAEAQSAIAADRERQINELLGSTSWRVTAPLRWLRSKFKPPH